MDVKTTEPAWRESCSKARTGTGALQLWPPEVLRPMQQPLSTTVFEFSCPRCAQHIQVESCHGGGWVECPRCQSTVIAPATQQFAGSYDDLAIDSEDSDDTLLQELQQLRASLSGSGSDRAPAFQASGAAPAGLNTW